MKTSQTLRKTPSTCVVHLKSLLIGLGLVSAGINSQALIVTSLGGSFSFGPDDLDYTQAASLASYSGPGTLIGVRVELSGSVVATLFATNDRDTAGMVTEMTEDVSFAIAGLPLAPLVTAIPTYSIPSFTLPTITTVTFPLAAPAPLVFIDLSAPFDVALYDFSQGAPALLPFQFGTTEAFGFSKIGSGIRGGSLAAAQGLVNVYYTVDTDFLVPPVPVPEVSTAVSAGCFAFLGVLILLRSRRAGRLQPIVLDSSHASATSGKSPKSIG